MFHTCCQQTTVKSQDLLLYRGPPSNSNQRVTLRSSRLNSAIENTSQPFRLYAKAKEDEQYRQLDQNKQYFIDKDFPPDEQSLGFYEGRKVQWVRLSKIYKQIEQGYFSSMDILTLKKNDSYFLASIAALTQSQTFIRDIFDEEVKISNFGAYKLKINIKGKPRQIIIDDYLPVFADNHLKAVFCRIEPVLAWVTLLEKVYAKIKGNYQNIMYGYAHQVLSTFSIGPCIYQLIPTDFRLEQQQKCWNTIIEAYQLSFPCVFGSRKQYTSQDIVPHQTYCLKSVQINIKGKNKLSERRVVLWNHPSKIERIVSAQILEQNNGLAISLPLVQFMRNFQIIDTSHIRKHYSSHFYSFKCSNQPHLLTFQINQKSNVYLTLQRQKGNKSRLRLILINYTNQASYEFIAGKKQDLYNDVTLRLQKLPLGKYILICESQSESTCLLRVYSSKLVTLNKFTGSSMILLEHTFFHMAQLNSLQHQLLDTSQHDWYFSKTMFQELGLGFFIITLGQHSAIKCQININGAQLQSQGLIIRNKHFKEQYFNIIEKGQSDVLIFDVKGNMSEAFSFPPDSMRIKMII